MCYHNIVFMIMLYTTKSVNDITKKADFFNKTNHITEKEGSYNNPTDHVTEEEGSSDKTDHIIIKNKKNFIKKYGKRSLLFFGSCVILGGLYFIINGQKTTITKLKKKRY